MLRFEAIVHSKGLRCRRRLADFAEIISRLANRTDRFAAGLGLRRHRLPA